MAGKTVAKEEIRQAIAGHEIEIARLETELGKVRAKVDALRELQAKLSGEPLPMPVAIVKQRIRRGDLKATVLSLLKERGVLGLNAAIAADITMQRGEPVDRNSVSSLLSRLMNDGIVDRVDNVYKLVGIKDASEADRVH